LRLRLMPLFLLNVKLNSTSRSLQIQVIARYFY
jgi:hypothetical protein